MENLVLGLFLFCVYFCSFSCLFYDEKQINKEIKNQKNEFYEQVKENLTEVIKEFETVEPIIELDSFKCSDIRKIASNLGIKIRQNGKVQTKANLISKIQDRLDVDIDGSVLNLIKAQIA